MVGREGLPRCGNLCCRSWNATDRSKPGSSTTSFPKKGRHSVGVTRQYYGELGKQDNCQVAVTLSIANHDASLPVAYRLYLPKDWASDRKRRRKVGVPEEITFKTKPEIALTQIHWACEAGLPRGAVLMDAGYGVDTDLRTSITALGLSYVAGIQSHTTVWSPGTGPRPPKQWSGHGRPPKLLRRDDKHNPVSVKKLALSLPKRACRKITWREGTGEKLSSRFARVRIRVAHRDYWLSNTRPEEWLLIEWPDGEKEPIKYWLSTLAADIAFRQLVDIAKLRWRIERDYQELKQEVGLGHFEGRGWRGFHHHATICIAAYGFLISERETIPPQQIVPPGFSRNLPYAKGTSPEDPPLRPERHVPNSIATMRRRLVAALAATLSRCPCCAARNRRPSL
jgi:SRSO17 transposase